VHISHGASTREAGVNMNNRGSPGLCFHYPLEADRMALSHVGAFDNNAIAVSEVLLKIGGAAPTKRSSQTGNGGAVSYSGLIFNLHRTQGGVELLH
jgi:hypothetical protein